MSPYDRTGAPPEDQPDPEHRPGIDCHDGWLPGHTRDDDQPKPCPVCRPNLTDQERRRRLYGPSDPGPIPTHQLPPENPPTTPPDGRNHHPDTEGAPQ